MLFADASRIPDDPNTLNRYLGGYAVAYRNIDASNARASSNDSPSDDDGYRRYLAKGWKVEWLPDILHGEMIAIAECYRTAFELAAAGKFDGRAKIFSDCRKAGEILSQIKLRKMIAFSGLFDEVLLTIVEAIIWYAHRLLDIQGAKDPMVFNRRSAHQRGHGSEIHWIPGHDHNVDPHQLVDRLAKDTWTRDKSAEEEFGCLYALDETPWTSTLGYQIFKSLVEMNVTNPRIYGIPARNDVLGPWRNGERVIDSGYSEEDERRAFIEYSLAQLEAKERGLEDGRAGEAEDGETGEAENEETAEVEEKTNERNNC